MNLISLIFLALFFSFVSNLFAANIFPGSSLYASNTTQIWSSPNNTFFVGFAQVGSSSYTVSIIYDGGVPVWTLGGSSAIVDRQGSFQFLRNGNLQLVNGSSATIWSSNTTSLGVTTASLDDYGNLVLYKGRIPVWSTFENPAETILPSQKFTVNHTLRAGVYSFRILRSGNLTLQWNDIMVYWNQGSGSVGSNLTSPSLWLQENGILLLSEGYLSRGVKVGYSIDYGEGSDVFRFLRLDKDGNLRMYSYSRGTGIANVTWTALADQCQVYGYCGNMGICSYNGTNSSPVCSCPSQNFEPVDMTDSRKGCKRKVEIQDCLNSATMLELKHTKFFTYQPEQIVIIGITACRVNCLQGGLACVASSSFSDGSGLCYLKTPEFVSGYQSPTVPSTSYVKICGPVEPNPSSSINSTGEEEEKCWTSRVWVLLPVVVASIAGVLAIVGVPWWLCYRRNPKPGRLSAEYTLLEYASGAPVQFSYKELHGSTKGFNDKLGAGGFGAVYKGVLSNKITTVAVKQLEGIEQGEKQFRMEVATISSTHHLNLVRLIGFCSEGRHRLLVYEFMRNGSLDRFLFLTPDQPGKLLTWEDRYKIALGTAKGITYLHEECRDCIVHCDIKPENILLDESFNAKVSDFGLAKLINQKDQRFRSLTSIRGTRGYLAPEWIANLPITSKSDVYSYGMVLLEIVSGRRNYEISPEIGQRQFSEWAYGEYEKGNVKEIVDARLVDQDVDMNQVRRVLEASFWCIQEHPSQRPSMGNVVQMVEGIVAILKPPAPKTSPEGSTSGTSITLSSSHSTSAASAPAPSSSSSAQTLTPLPLASFSGRKLERASSSLIESFRSELH